MIKIDQRQIGAGQPPYIVAELSANHGGDLQKALDTMTAARDAGADAIKLQTYTPDTMTIRSDRPEFQISDGLWAGHSLYELYQWAHTPFEWHQALFDHARALGITCFSTPFDETAVDLLESLGAPAYKIASFEATDLPLIRYVAQTGKPMIISTGMANLDEIMEAVQVTQQAGCSQLILLHCISSYPAPIDQANLQTLVDLHKRTGVQVGLSNHTLGNTAALVAVALGACFIEKHFTLDRSDASPDASFSILPDELKELVNQSQDAWLSLGQAGYSLKDAEKANLRFRRSVYFVRDLQQGDTITSADVRRIRPGYGLPPRDFEAVIGRTVRCDISAGTAVSWELIQQ